MSQRVLWAIALAGGAVSVAIPYLLLTNGAH